MLMYLKDNTQDLVQNNKENNIICPSKSAINIEKHTMTQDTHACLYPMNSNACA